MTMQFEAAGDMAGWPRNEPGKPTQAIVFGVYHSSKKETFQILWQGKFPILDTALYWAAKKELEAVRKGKWMAASRVVWQHDLTPEEALAVARRSMEPQIKRAMEATYGGDGALDIGPGPMRVIGRDEAVARYVEIAPSADSDETLASFVLPPTPLPPERDDL